MTDFPDKWKERKLSKPSYSWIVFYANAVENTAMQRNFCLPVNLQFKDLCRSCNAQSLRLSARQRDGFWSPYEASAKHRVSTTNSWIEQLKSHLRNQLETLNFWHALNDCACCYGNSMKKTLRNQFVVCVKFPKLRKKLLDVGWKKELPLEKLLSSI